VQLGRQRTDAVGARNLSRAATYEHNLTSSGFIARQGNPLPGTALAEEKRLEGRL